MPAFTEAWLKGPQSTQFYTHTYSPTFPRAVLVFVHGFVEHIARYTHVFPRWRDRGVAVFTFDQRGSGRTATEVGKKSKDSAYGKTNTRDQIEDIEWALRTAREKFGDVPMFLMGHSMGGALALAFPTRASPPPSPEIVTHLSGVISTSPLIKQTHPTGKIVKWAGGKLANVLPYTTIPIEVKADAISHDEAVNSAYTRDPLVKQAGTLRGVSDMLNTGDKLLDDSQRWPQGLPLLLIHGTSDEVTSFKASEEFYNKVPATDKTFTPFEGGYHELHNEPDGVKEKMIDGCISWVEAHLPSQTEQISKL